MHLSQQNVRVPQIGEIYMMRFEGHGSEQSGLRPGLVFQNNTGNKYSPNIIELPITSAMKKLGQPTHILLKASETGLRMDSVVLCENPERMSKERIGKYITKLPEQDMKRVTEGSLLATSAISFLDMESLIRIWRMAAALNTSKTSI